MFNSSTNKWSVVTVLFSALMFKMILVKMFNITSNWQPHLANIIYIILADTSDIGIFLVSNIGICPKNPITVIYLCEMPSSLQSARGSTTDHLTQYMLMDINAFCFHLFEGNSILQVTVCTALMIPTWGKQMSAGETTQYNRG